MACKLTKRKWKEREKRNKKKRKKKKKAKCEAKKCIEKKKRSNEVVAVLPIIKVFCTINT